MQSWTIGTGKGRGVRQVSGSNGSPPNEAADQSPRDSVEVKSTSRRSSANATSKFEGAAPKRTSVAKRHFLAQHAPQLPRGEAQLVGSLVPGIAEESETPETVATSTHETHAESGEGEKAQVAVPRTAWGSTVVPTRQKQTPDLTHNIPEKRRADLEAMAIAMWNQIKSDDKDSRDRCLNLVFVAATIRSDGMVWTSPAGAKTDVPEVGEHARDMSLSSSEDRLYLIRQLAEQMPGNSALKAAIAGGLAKVAAYCATELNITVSPLTFAPVRNFRGVCAKSENKQLLRYFDKSIAQMQVPYGTPANAVVEKIKGALIDKFGLAEELKSANLREVPDWKLLCFAKAARDANCQKARDVLSSPNASKDRISNVLDEFLRAKGGDPDGVLIGRAYQDVHEKDRALVNDGPRRVFERLNTIVSGSLLQKFGIDGPLQELDAEKLNAVVLSPEFRVELEGAAEEELKKVFGKVNVQDLPIEFCALVAGLVDAIDAQIAGLGEHEARLRSVARSNFALRTFGAIWNANTAQFEGASRKLSGAVDKAFLKCIEKRPEECGYDKFLDAVIARGRKQV